MIAALGPALRVLPISVLRAGVGVLLLFFGLGWLRKAVLRAAGRKAMHDEREAYERERLAARRTAATGRERIDGYSFVIALKAVLLEGLEVAFIAVGFGAAQHRVALAAAAALVAVALVVLAGVAVREPLARVPENTMKFGVGVMLTAFGTFWAAEGVGARWPGGDAALLVLVPAIAAASLALVLWLRRSVEMA